MKNLTKEVHSLRDFQRNAAELARRIKRTGRPLVLAINNKAKLVVQDAASYERMLQQIDKLESNRGDSQRVGRCQTWPFPTRQGGL